MAACLFRIQIFGPPAIDEIVELQRYVELSALPDVGRDVRSLVSNHHSVPPLTVSRIQWDSHTQRFIVDLDGVRGDFPSIMAALKYEGWRPHLEFRFDNPDMAVSFAWDHGYVVVKMGDAFYALPSDRVWCLDRCGVAYDWVPLGVERN